MQTADSSHVGNLEKVKDLRTLSQGELRNRNEGRNSSVQHITTYLDLLPRHAHSQRLVLSSRHLNDFKKDKRTCFLIAMQGAEPFFRIYSGTRTIGSGLIEVAKEKQFDYFPTIWNKAFAWDLVTNDAIEHKLGKLLEGIESCDCVDRVLVQLHGAIVSRREADGYALKSVHRSVGKDVPMIATQDLVSAQSSKLLSLLLLG